MTNDQLRFFNAHGYLQLPGFFDLGTIAKTNAFMDDLWKHRSSPANPVVTDIFLGTPRQKRVYLRHAPVEARSWPHKVNDLFLEHREIRRLCLDSKLTGVLSGLLGGTPMVCNTLSLEFGSEQGYHVDTLFMPGPKVDTMIASWIAFEDVHPDAGALMYYPGSHLIPPHIFSHGGRHVVHAEFQEFVRYYAEQIEERGLKPEKFYAKAGDLFIWHEQLYHGGSPIADRSKTRRSLVTHYWRAEEFAPEQIVQSDTGGCYFRRGHQPVT